MKILHVTENYLPSIGGMEVMVSGMAEAQSVSGHQVHVAATHRPDGTETESEIEGVHVHRFDARRALADRDPVDLLMARKAFAAMRKRIAPDITHLHLCGASMVLALQTHAVAPSPIVTTPHCPLPTRLGTDDEFTARVLRASDAIVCISRFMRDAVEAYAPAVSDRTKLVYTGVQCRPTAGSGHEGPPILLAIGRGIEEKGFDVLVAALAELPAHLGGVRLRIAGDGPAIAALPRQAEELGIAERLELLGWVPPNDLPDIISAASVVVVPSRWEEPLGLVSIEAACQGKPVVVSRVGGLPETVVEGRTALVVEPDDPAALAAALTSCLSDPSLSAGMGEAGRAFVADRFGFEAFIQAHDALYASLAGRG